MTAWTECYLQQRHRLVWLVVLAAITLILIQLYHKDYTHAYSVVNTLADHTKAAYDKYVDSAGYLKHQERILLVHKYGADTGGVGKSYSSNDKPLDDLSPQGDSYVHTGVGRTKPGTRHPGRDTDTEGSDSGATSNGVHQQQLYERKRSSNDQLGDPWRDSIVFSGDSIADRIDIATILNAGSVGGEGTIEGTREGTREGTIEGTTEDTIEGTRGRSREGTREGTREDGVVGRSIDAISGSVLRKGSSNAGERPRSLDKEERHSEPKPGSTFIEGVSNLEEFHPINNEAGPSYKVGGSDNRKDGSDLREGDSTDIEGDTIQKHINNGKDESNYSDDYLDMDGVFTEQKESDIHSADVNSHSADRTRNSKEKEDGLARTEGGYANSGGARQITGNIHRKDGSMSPSNTSLQSQSVLQGQSIGQGHGDLSMPERLVPEVSCERLFQADTDTVLRAERMMRAGQLPYRMLTYQQLQTARDNCSEFRRSRHYISEPLSEEENHFRIAYSILIYKDAAMFERLLRAIYRPQNYYCVHIDAKSSDYFYKSVESVTSCFRNVFIATQKVTVYWGYNGVLAAEIVCMRELMKYGGTDAWKYFINLTGQEFPLKTNKEIVQILKALDGANVISNLPAMQWSARWRFVHNHTHYNTHIPKTAPPYGLRIHKGDAHVILSREFVKFILNDIKVVHLLEWLEDTFCPEELFYATLQYNTQLKAPGAYSGLDSPPISKTTFARHKIWVTDKVPCLGMVRNNICIYGMRALPSLQQDSLALFVNKLYSNYQPLTYDCLEELHFNRTREDYTTDTTRIHLDYYRNLYYVKKHF